MVDAHARRAVALRPARDRNTDGRSNDDDDDFTDPGAQRYVNRDGNADRDAGAVPVPVRADAVRHARMAAVRGAGAAAMTPHRRALAWLALAVYFGCALLAAHADDAPGLVQGGAAWGMGASLALSAAWWARGA